jgi:cytosine/adenosine deaminase-related metal-dependent hydrolase
MSCAGKESIAPTSVAFINVSVPSLDGGPVVTNQTVVVQNGAISALGPAGRVPIPSGAEIVNGAGKFLLPGLVDTHVHLANNPPDEQRALLKLFVANGVTTVVNLRGGPQMLELRKAVADSAVLGPTVYTVGPFVNEPFVTTADEVEAAVVAQKRAGYDFIKLHGDLSLESYRRLNAVARREGIRVIGHAPRNLGVEVMFEERQYAVAHAEEFLYDQHNNSRDFLAIEPRIPELARAMVQAGIWLMPNFTAYKMIARQADDLSAVLARPEMRYLPQSVQKGWGPATNPYTSRFGKDTVPGFVARYQLLEKLVREFQAAGVRLLIGTDAMNAGVVPGFSVHDEMADFVAAGLTPQQALRAGTVNAADFLGRGAQSGVVAAGRTADLLLLDANPLDDVANSRRIAGVMVRGRWLNRAALDALLAEIRSPQG